MAIRRTKEQKQRAVERRTQEYSFVEAKTEKLDKPVAVKKTPQASILDSGLSRHQELTSAHLRQDINRIVFTTIALAVILVGIWYGTRYNGVSLF